MYHVSCNAASWITPVFSWYHAFDINIDCFRTASTEKTDRTRVPEVDRTAATALLRVFSYRDCIGARKEKGIARLIHCSVVVVGGGAYQSQQSSPTSCRRATCQGSRRRARCHLLTSRRRVSSGVERWLFLQCVRTTPAISNVPITVVFPLCVAANVRGLATGALCMCLQKRANPIQQGGWGLVAVSGDRRKACGIPRKKCCWLFSPSAAIFRLDLGPFVAEYRDVDFTLYGDREM